MSKHYVKPYVIAMAAILIGLSLMAFEARAAPLASEAGCYAMASASKNVEQAKYHRDNLKDYRHDRNSQVDYYIGYQMGRLTALAKSLGIPRSDVAASEYNEHCMKRV